MKLKIRDVNFAKLSGLGLIIMWIVMNRGIATNMRQMNESRNSNITCNPLAYSHCWLHCLEYGQAFKGIGKADYYNVVRVEV